MKNPFSFLAKKIAAGVSKVFRAIAGSDAAKSFAQATLSFLQTELGELVKTFVLSADAHPEWSNADKFAYVLKQTKLEATARGKVAPDAVLGLLINAVVAEARGHITK